MTEGEKMCKNNIFVTNNVAWGDNQDIAEPNQRRAEAAEADIKQQKALESGLLVVGWSVDCST